jgi:hypothetical protein
MLTRLATYLFLLFQAKGNRKDGRCIGEERHSKEATGKEATGKETTSKETGEKD